LRGNESLARAHARPPPLSCLVMQSAAIGFRVHSGWAALVAVAGSPNAPEILLRRRIQMVDRASQGAVQPYHAAAVMQLRDAEKFLTHCSADARKRARGEIARVVSELAGHRVVACGMLVSSGRALGTLESTLASHAAIHAAEGQHFRNAIRSAGEDLGLALHEVKEKELFVRAAEKLGLPADRIAQTLAAIGKRVGPPWTQDEKFAALSAWLALASI
jgi:hypothetical protein